MRNKTKNIALVLTGIVIGATITGYAKEEKPEYQPIFKTKTEYVFIQKVENKKEEPKKLNLMEKIAKTFPECPDVAIAIAKAESGLKPQATGYNNNGSVDRGIFQINSIHGYGEELYNPETNLKIARKIYEKNGWNAWSTYKSGAYLKHLN